MAVKINPTDYGETLSSPALLRAQAIAEKSALEKEMAMMSQPRSENPFISATTAPESPPMSLSTSPLGSNFRVSQEYGNYNPGLYSGKTAGARHQGMDVATPEGTPVKAPFSGLVKVGQSKDFGKFVEVRTADGQIMRFSHLKNIDDLVSQLSQAGREIQAGQQLGLTGNTGYSTAPHLDIMYQKGGQWTNPLQFDPLRQSLGR